MRMVGTVALDVGRAPGASAVALACDLCAAAAQVTGMLVFAAGTIARGVVAALRARGPMIASLTTSYRVPTPWTVTVTSPHAGGMPVPRLPVDARPPHRSTTRTRPPGSGHRELVLPAEPTAPGTARAFLRCATDEWEIDDDLAQDAAMVITELVANAVDHARTESTLSLSTEHGAVRVAVRDARPGPLPRPAPIDPAAPRGRGLQMVDALTTAWGVTLHADGKTVWATVGPAQL